MFCDKLIDAKLFSGSYRGPAANSLCFRMVDGEPAGPRHLERLHGFWLLVDGRELMLPFDEFPRFKRAAVEAILNVERQGPAHLYWPDLDVDPSLGSIEHRERYPLKFRDS